MSVELCSCQRGAKRQLFVPTSSIFQLERLHTNRILGRKVGLGRLPGVWFRSVSNFGCGVYQGVSARVLSNPSVRVRREESRVVSLCPRWEWRVLRRCPRDVNPRSCRKSNISKSSAKLAPISHFFLVCRSGRVLAPFRILWPCGQVAQELSRLLRAAHRPRGCMRWRDLEDARRVPDPRQSVTVTFVVGKSSRVLPPDGSDGCLARAMRCDASRAFELCSPPRRHADPRRKRTPTERLGAGCSRTSAKRPPCPATAGRCGAIPVSWVFVLPGPQRDGGGGVSVGLVRFADQGSNIPSSRRCRWTVPIALTAGNCVILKPSERVPLTMYRVSRLLTEAG